MLPGHYMTSSRALAFPEAYGVALAGVPSSPSHGIRTGTYKLPYLVPSQNDPLACAGSVRRSGVHCTTPDLPSAEFVPIVPEGGWPVHSQRAPRGGNTQTHTRGAPNTTRRRIDKAVGVTRKGG